MEINKILIASNNPHKIKEIQSIISVNRGIEVLTLGDLKINEDVEETGATLNENAELKAKAIFKLSGIPAVSDDTGLFVDALNGEPGIYSARYAGENVSYKDNCDKLLKNLAGVPFEKRTSVFKSVICLFVSEAENYFFEGECRGKILNEPRGDGGFGYDPLFLPEGFERTFAEMKEHEKNKISHRAKALEKLKNFLKNEK